MKKSFSLIELVIVIIVVGILYSSINFSLANSSLNQAADQIISHINYTRHLAIKDNKMQYYPINASKTEMNRSKYWFKQWWQIRFWVSDNNCVYEIFTDLPYNTKSNNFDKSGNTPTNDKYRNLSYAKNPVTQQYLTGLSYDDDNNYPRNYDPKLNLTKSYSINKIVINGKDVNKSKRFIFDAYGNCYTYYKDGDAGDINPYDISHNYLLKTTKITLCQDEDCEKNISICLSPKIANAYICK